MAITLIPFAILTAFMLFAVAAGWYLALALVPLAGLFLLRLFIIQHDCGHGSFFRSKKMNDWLGRALGTLTFTPYDCWGRSHALHHASTGNLDARGFGDVDTLTVAEFRNKSAVARFGYRLYRHPVTLLGFGPTYLFLLRHRLPVGHMRDGWRYWVSAMVTNLVIVAMLAGLAAMFGIVTTILVVLPVLLTAATVGVWLFYVQHQFDEAHWNYRPEWSFHDAALGGSSYLDLPPLLAWFTGNIGIHHIHHLVSRIPFYRLPDALAAHPELRGVNRIALHQTFRPLVLTLWDEEKQRLVSFREASLAS